jgi:hypothetical protein
MKHILSQPGKSQLITRSSGVRKCYDMEVGENHVRVFYCTAKREGENSRYMDETSAPTAVAMYQISNIVYICNRKHSKPSQNLSDLPELPTFNPLQPIAPSHKVWNRLPNLFSELNAITPIEIFNYFRSGAVNDGIATLLWMDSSPVTIMSTIHPLSGKDSLVLRMRKHPGNKSTNTSGAKSTFLPRERQKELDIPVIVDAYNQHKVGVDVADQY